MNFSFFREALRENVPTAAAGVICRLHLADYEIEGGSGVCVNNMYDLIFHCLKAF